MRLMHQPPDPDGWAWYETNGRVREQLRPLEDTLRGFGFRADHTTDLFVLRRTGPNAKDFRMPWAECAERPNLALSRLRSLLREELEASDRDETPRTERAPSGHEDAVLT